MNHKLQEYLMTDKPKHTRILHKLSDSHFRLTKVIYQRSNLDKLLDLVNLTLLRNNTPD